VLPELSTWPRFNDDSTKNGVEGRFHTQDGKRYIYLEPTNCKGDWKRNFGGWLIPVIRYDGIYHRYWYNNAMFVMGVLFKLQIAEPVTEVHAFGYSKGGGECSILKRRNACTTLIGINAPCGFIGIADGLNIGSKNELVKRLGFWRKRRSYPAVSRWFWKNHALNTSQVSDIIQGVY